MTTPTPFDFAAMQAEAEFQSNLSTADPRHKAMCSVEDDGSSVCVYWGGYEYPISLPGIRDEAHLLGWVTHLGAKTWPHMTPYRLVLFARMVCQAKGWQSPHV